MCESDTEGKGGVVVLFPNTEESSPSTLVSLDAKLVSHQRSCCQSSHYTVRPDRSNTCSDNTL